MTCQAKLHQKFLDSDLPATRLSVCNDCALNSNGVCLPTEKKHPGKADVAHGVVRMELRCPEGKWGAVSERCPLCDRAWLTEEGGMCPFCENKLRLSQGNSPTEGMVRIASPRRHTIEPKPFTGEVIRNLHYFLYPRHRESTEYHLKQLRQSVAAFNGKRVCCVATDEHTIQDDIKADLESLFTDVWYTRNMKTRRELVGFVPSLERLHSLDENEIICFAHGKGQQEHTKDAKVIRDWTDIMYEMSVRNHVEVEHAMSQGYPVAGVFRSIGAFRATQYKWHYSGSFWWARSQSLFNNPGWRKTCNRWWGSESYVGRHWRSSEGYVLFGDNVANGSLYHQENVDRFVMEMTT